MKRLVVNLGRKLGFLPVPKAPEEPTLATTISKIKDDQFYVHRLVLGGREGGTPLVAGIFDEFTADCMRYEVDMMLVHPGEAWKRDIVSLMPNLFFMESSWKGNGTWGTIDGRGPLFAQIEEIVAECKRLGIPTVFWNKEDPVHTERFSGVARLFDYVYTSDENLVPLYKEQYDIDAIPMTFAAQPAIHNPLEVTNRLDKAVFAGTYYAEFPERCADFEVIIGCLEAAGIEYEIYDRCANIPLEKRGHHIFPERFEERIVGCLPPSEMWRVYKGYKYQINLNTVKISPTMFARRVFESLASGTPVISNPSLAMCRYFDGIVITCDSEADQARLRSINGSADLYRETVEAGVLAVMREHTYAHRLHEIFNRVGIPVELQQKKIRVALQGLNWDDCETLVRAQTWKTFELVGEHSQGINATVTQEDLSDTLLFEKIACGLYGG